MGHAPAQLRIDSGKTLFYELCSPILNLPQLGRNGREHGKENFLMTTNVRRWLLPMQLLLRGALGNLVNALANAGLSRPSPTLLKDRTQGGVDAPV